MSTDTDSVELVGDRTVEDIATAALLAALTAALAQLSFPYPLSPAPVTMQVFGVFLAGIVLGPLWGPASVVLYLTVGAIGLPVFATGGAGPGTLVGPTGGFLLSYPFAAALIGAVVHRGSSLRDPATVSKPVLAGAMVAGTLLIYAGGAAGLMIVAGYSLSDAVIAGAVVFFPAEAVKIAATVAVARSGRLPSQ
ncbi:biotin transporter BioY [Halostella sp. PRR32]|uniref:biotin transporter BioY n=1 Tax=Halostella sp. PRR32 TaxID=3098147 RepID=UPI002B1E269B|nr:biotin transporter BioY [Halostella sp. PRR32]